jgi:Cu(I)/Ag(I) efflux system membrane protein CusA/SilA
VTYASLVQEMDAKLRYPGMPNTWWMPIQTRNEMLSTGVRSQLGIKVFGPDLATIEGAALAIERAIRDVPGTRSAFAERLTGGFYLDIEWIATPSRATGLRVRDVSRWSSLRSAANVAQTVEVASATRSQCATRATSARTSALSASW